MELFKLFGSILVDNEEANKSISATDKKAEGLAGKLKSVIGTAAKVGVGIAAAAGAAGGAMLGLANKTAETADFIDKLSERTGINREELQRWKYAADQSGADISKLEVGIKKLSDTMDDASNGSEKNIKAFAKLGISMDDLKNKSQSDIFEEVMYALSEMPQGAERNALGNDLLGKSYTELLPLLNAGADGMSDLKNRADELGLVMSEDAVKAGVKFGDTWADLKSAFGAVFTHLGTELIPIFQAMADWILSHMPEIKAVVGTVFTFIATVVGKVTDALKAMYNFIEPYLPAAAEIVRTTFGAIKDTVQTVVDIFEKVTSAVKTAISWLKSWNNTKAEDKSSAYSTINRYSHYADGTDYASGGLALVGERGPELVQIPRGSKVYTAEETAGMLGGTVNLDAPIQLIVDGKEVAAIVSRIQLDNTRGRARAVGVSI